MGEEYKQKSEEEKKLRMDAYVKAIKKNGIPKRYIESGNPMKMVLEDLAAINGGPISIADSDEDYERWRRKWGED